MKRNYMSALGACTMMMGTAYLLKTMVKLESGVDIKLWICFILSVLLGLYSARLVRVHDIEGLLLSYMACSIVGLALALLDMIRFL